MRTINTVTIILLELIILQTICHHTIQSVLITDNTNYDSYEQSKRDDLSTENTAASADAPHQKQSKIHEVSHATSAPKSAVNRENVPPPSPSLNTDRGAASKLPLPNRQNAKFGTDGGSRPSFGSLNIANSFPAFGPNVIKSGFANGGFSHSFAAARLNTTFRHNFPTSFGHDGGLPSVFNKEGGGSGGLDSVYNNVQPIIHKSVYVHVAPPDDDIPKRQKVIVPEVRPQKNYQIVFIKAPTPPPPAAPIIPPLPPQSDKTVIYVLHPKPEEAPPIRIPTPPPKLPVKPEVYFIRYKARKENSIEDFDTNYRRRSGRNDEEKDDETTDTTEIEGKNLQPEELNYPSNLQPELNYPSNLQPELNYPSSLQPELNYPSIQYDEDEASDTPGESSNIIQFLSNKRGNNAH